MILKKKKVVSFILIFLCCAFLFAIWQLKRDKLGKNENTSKETLQKIENKNDNVDDKILKKGYNLPINDKIRNKAENECKNVMNLVFNIYDKANKGKASNVVLSNKVLDTMIEKVASEGNIVTTTEPYFNMGNYEMMEKSLKKMQNGEKESVVIYKIQVDGLIGREEYRYDGKDMYLLNTIASWDEKNKPIISYITYDKIKEWKYTKKGWFCYEVCVPEVPEVTETVDGSCMIRVQPLTKKQQEYSRKFVSLLGYQGNNLLCSNWDQKHMEKIDYNGLYEYLYLMKYNKHLGIDVYPNGIPKKEFEKLIMEYLPITKSQLEKYAVYDKKKKIYQWERLGCFNYIPHFFGTAYPEVVDIKKNKDGTITLKVDAVCEMMLCDDEVMSHELTIQLQKNGSFKYFGNKILDDGLEKIPDYQYRIKG